MTGGYVATRDFFRRYPKLITLLFNVHHHMKNLKYDFPIVICGDTGNGKSMFLLHVIDIWYNLILNERLTPAHIKHVKNTREEWVKNFKEIRPLDINSNDEGTDGLMSKEQMKGFGRDIQKLYNVFRKKLYFTPILIPDYFDLPMFFRKRIRGCFWINKRGCFKYYSKQGLMYLNSFNMTKPLKLMTRAYPLFSGTFPDYQGVLREAYDDMSSESTDKILDELISEMKNNPVSGIQIDYSDIKDAILEGKKQREIASELNVSNRTIREQRAILISQGKLER